MTLFKRREKVFLRRSFSSKLRFYKSQELATIRQSIKNFTNLKKHLINLDIVVMVLIMVNLIVSYIENLQQFTDNIAPLLTNYDKYIYHLGTDIGMSN